MGRSWVVDLVCDFLGVHQALAVWPCQQPSVVIFLPMFGKRKRTEVEDASPGVKLKHNIIDLYSKGDISAQRCASLLGDAAASKVLSCHLPHSTARARDLQRGLARSSGWPPLYVCDAPLKGRDGNPCKAPVAFLLPHEVLHELVLASDGDCITSTQGSLDMLLSNALA